MRMLLGRVSMFIYVVWEVLQALGFRVWTLQDKARQGQLMGLEPKYGVLTPIVFWGKTMMDSWHMMDEDDSAWKDDSNASKII